jgi:thioester reductase-like protein
VHAQGSANGGVDLRKILSETAPEQHEAVVVEMVRSGVAKVLEFSSPEDVDVGLPLQDIGIDSLMAVMLRNQLQDMTGLALSAKIAFDHPNLRSLGQFLLAKLQESGLAVQAVVQEEAAASPEQTVVAKRVDDKVARNGYLEPELEFKNAATTARNPEAVFLTGATGFAGAFVLHELLNSNVAVYCLVRASDAEHAMTRLLETLGNYGLLNPDHERLLTPVVGDLAQPFFGMREDDFNELAEQVDAICHSAALVDWMLPLEDYLGPNVVSTHEVLRLASRGRGKAVHFLSTTSTLPKYLGYEVPVDAAEYGYMTSKWMAEQMVAAARWRGALASVYRLPFIAASSTTGHFRLDKGDFLHNFIAGCIEMGCFPSLDFSLKCMLPVDYLAKVIAQVIMRDPERIGRDYDFINQDAPSFNRFVHLIRSAGCRVETVPFGEWQTKALQYAKSHRKSSLARIAMLVDGLVPRDLELSLEGLAFRANVLVLDGESYLGPSMDERSVQPYVARISAALSAPINPPAKKSAEPVRPLAPQPVPV